jgi:hypothetical protein
MIGIVLIGLTLPKRWEEKRKLEKKFPYWKLKSTSYWCRFFLFFWWLLSNKYISSYSVKSKFSWFIIFF